jgi:cyclophilin family peptidyl-prolyl cis-trans isomerase
MSRFLLAPLSALLFALAPGSMVSGAPPELLDPLQPENGAPRVAANVPFGKTLVLPLAAADPDGDLLEFHVTTSNPKVFAQVHTGNPILRVHVEYAGDPAAVPPAEPFAGDLEFQLFRDLTPVTAGTIAGLAQSGYYDNLIFHRIIPDFVAQGGDPAGNGSGLSDPTNPNSYIGLPFSFEHEFRPTLIFAGRGQLAMANSNGGYERGTHVGSGFIQLGDFSPTNGSQFFITFAQPRHLDFKHTIFGQLLRGFDILDKMETVPRDSADKPTVAVKMTSVTVAPGRSDATLFVSATAMGRTGITVTARDPAGNQATRTFDVIVVEDEVNDPPVLKPVPNLITPVGVAPNLPLNAFDLEHDYLLFGIAAAGGATDANAFGQASIATNYNPRQTAGFQNFAVGVAGFNDPAVGASPSAANPFAPFDSYSFRVAELGYGDRPVEGFSRNVGGVAGVLLDHVIVAEFRDADAGGRPADFTAIVNWGDGTAEQSSTTTPDPPVLIERSPERPGRLVVKASHTYARAGNYLVRVIIDAPLGATAQVLSSAVISDPSATARVIGRDLDVSGPRIRDRMIAQIEPVDAAVLNEPPAVVIDWGDGATSPGVVRRSGDSLAVFGTHTYRDAATYAAQTFLVDSAVPPTGNPVGASSIRISGVPSGRRAPPVDMPNLVGQISTLSGQQFKTTTGTGASTTTRFACSIVIVNAGNKKSRVGKVRFYLSSDAHLNLAPITHPTGPPTPADVPLTIGSFPEGTIPALAPGGGLRFVFEVTPDQDLRLIAPKGETGAGLFVLANLTYKDPIADHMPINHDVTFGPINGIIVSPQQLQVKEEAGAEHSASFTVRLDRPPMADVKIPLAVSDATEIEIDKTELIFTAQNWNVTQSVLVTAKDDATKESAKTSVVRLQPSISTDLRWNAMDGDDVSVTVAEND